MALSFVMLLLCALNCPLGTNKVFLNLNFVHFEILRQFIEKGDEE